MANTCFLQKLIRFAGAPAISSMTSLFCKKNKILIASLLSINEIEFANMSFEFVKLNLHYLMILNEQHDNNARL